jgi:hypothetical protein
MNRRPLSWRISRARRTLTGEIIFVPVGTWRAWTRDDAIRKAAYAIRRPAVLRAEIALCEK